MMAGPVQNKFLDTISGYALLPAHLATVYYDYLPRIPGGESNKNDTALVLGCVIAHELGHLLIPGDAHSLTGIMSTQWTYRQWEDIVAERLLLDGKQAKAIHRHLEGE